MSSLSRFLAIEGNIRVLAVQTLVSQLGFGMLYVVYQPYILSTGLKIVDLGTVQSIINFSTAAGLFVWGPLSDLFGRKRVILLGHLSRVVAVLALLISGNAIFLYVFAFFIGFSALWMQMNPARTALIAESVPNEKRATAYSTLAAISQGTSMVMGSVGDLAIVSGYRPIFAVTLICEAAGIIIMSLFMRETHHAEGASGTEIGSRIIANLRPERDLMTICFMMVVIGIGYGVGFSLLYGALTDTYRFTTFELGLMSTVSSLVWALGSIPGGKLSERFGTRSMVLVSTAASLTAVVGFIFFRSFAAFLIFNAFNGLSNCLWLPNWTSIIAEKTSVKVRASILGKLDAYAMFAGIPAPFIAGLIYARYGFTAPLLVHLGCLLVWGSMLLRITEKPSKEL